jgi:hypothetical protein
MTLSSASSALNASGSTPRTPSKSTARATTGTPGSQKRVYNLNHSFLSYLDNIILTFNL